MTTDLSRTRSPDSIDVARFARCANRSRLRCVIGFGQVFVAVAMCSGPGMLTAPSGTQHGASASAASAASSASTRPAIKVAVSANRIASIDGNLVILTNTRSKHLNRKTAACSEDSAHLGNGLHSIRDEHQPRLTEHHIKRPGFERQGRCVSLAPFDMRLDPLCDLQHRLAQVQPDKHGVARTACGHVLSSQPLHRSES